MPSDLALKTMNGVHRAMIVTAALLILGGIVSFLGIRNPVHEQDAPGAAGSAAPTVAPVAQTAEK